MSYFFFLSIIRINDHHNFTEIKYIQYIAFVQAKVPNQNIFNFQWNSTAKQEIQVLQPKGDQKTVTLLTINQYSESKNTRENPLIQNQLFSTCKIYPFGPFLMQYKATWYDEISHNCEFQIGLFVHGNTASAVGIHSGLTIDSGQ